MSDSERLLDQRTRKADQVEFVSFAVALIASTLAIIGLAGLIVSMSLTNRRLAHAITERLAAEAAQRASEARYRAIFANTADLLSVIDVAAGRPLPNERGESRV